MQKISENAIVDAINNTGSELYEIGIILSTIKCLGKIPNSIVREMRFIRNPFLINALYARITIRLQSIFETNKKAQPLNLNFLIEEVKKKENITVLIQELDSFIKSDQLKKLKDDRNNLAHTQQNQEINFKDLKPFYNLYIDILNIFQKVTLALENTTEAPDFIMYKEHYNPSLNYNSTLMEDNGIFLYGFVEKSFDEFLKVLTVEKRIMDLD